MIFGWVEWIVMNGFPFSFLELHYIRVFAHYQKWQRNPNRGKCALLAFAPLLNEDDLCAAPSRIHLFSRHIL